MFEAFYAFESTPFTRSIDTDGLFLSQKAEEMLADLRRSELMDANSVIKAQESLIDFSSRELHEANRIINAAESVVELGRQEAISLREELADTIKRNKELTEEVGRLKEEIKSLGGKGRR